MCRNRRVVCLVCGGTLTARHCGQSGVGPATVVWGIQGIQRLGALGENC